MGASKPFSPEVRERAVRLVQEHEGEYDTQWAAITSIAGKIGCSAETLRGWARQAERNTGRRAGLTTEERERLKALERGNRELKRAKEILRKARRFSRRRSPSAFGRRAGCSVAASRPATRRALRHLASMGATTRHPAEHAAA